MAVAAGASSSVHPAAGAPALVIDAARPTRHVVSRDLFGLGVDVTTSTYVRPGDTGCLALAGAERDVSLVRVGAGLADDYDWRSDRYAVHTTGRLVPASFGCFTPPLNVPAASVVRALDRARALGAEAVVVLNGEVDDPQATADEVRLVARRYGLPFAQRVYWEIGNSPARWQYFGVPLSRRQTSAQATCTPDQYAALVTAYAAAIRAALGGSTPRIVADEWIANATDQSWTGVVAAVDTQYFPFRSPSRQPTAASVVGSITQPPSSEAGSLDDQIGGLQANLAQDSGGIGDVGLFVGQWDLDQSSDGSYPVYGSAAQGAFVARLLIHLARDGVRMAAWAPPVYGNPPAPFVYRQPTPGFDVLSALRRAIAGAHLVPVTRHGRLPDSVDVLAARTRGGSVVVVGVNASSTATATLPLDLRGLAARRRSATRWTSDAATPHGAVTTDTFASPAVALRIPPIGVVILSLDGR